MHAYTFGMANHGDLWRPRRERRPPIIKPKGIRRPKQDTHGWIKTHQTFLDGQLPRLVDDSVLDLQALQATFVPKRFLEVYLAELGINDDALLITVILPTAIQVVHEYAFFSNEAEFAIVHIDMAHCTNLRYVGHAAFFRDPDEMQGGLESLVFPTGADITLADECFAGHPLREIAWGSVTHILPYAFCEEEPFRKGPPDGGILRLKCLDFSNTRVTFIGQCAFVQDFACDYLRFGTDVVVTHEIQTNSVDGIPGKSIVVHAEALLVNCENIILPSDPPNNFLVRQVDHNGQEIPPAAITQFINKNPNARLLKNTYVNTYYHEKLIRPHEANSNKSKNPNYAYEPARAAVLDTLFAQYPDNFGRLRAVQRDYAINMQLSVAKNTKHLPEAARGSPADIFGLVLPFTFSDMTR